MTFDIGILDEAPAGFGEDDAGHFGEIILGDTKELFAVAVGYWSPRDYARQWKEGVRRLVTLRKPSCLVTSINDPDEAEVLTWWLLYPSGEQVHVQDALLLLREESRDFATRNPYDSIPPRRQFNSEGQPISEWTVPLADFVAFLDEAASRCTD